jgi:AcrR family transcriptional regulator
LATNSTAAGGPDNAVRRRILATARELFQKYGPRRTTMEDIAAATGLARPALYKYVASRDEIIEAVILLRVEELSDGFRSVLEEATSFAEAFVEVCMAAVNAARLDPELQSLFETTTGTRIIQVMVGPNPGFHEFVKTFFKEAFAEARAAGLMRTDVDDDALTDWIRGIIVMMILREDLDAEREREMIRAFLLHSILPIDRAVDISETRSKARPAPKRRRTTKAGR